LTSAGPFSYQLSGAKQFKYAFCQNITSNPCPPDNRVGASIQLPSSGVGCQTVWGTLANTEASLISTDPTQGMVLTYRGGDACGLDATFSTTFTLQCDPSVSTLRVTSLPDPGTGCNLQYTIRTKVACPAFRPKTVPSLGAGWIVFIVLVLLGALYLGGGMAYKRVVYGASGFESIPNIDTWRAVRRVVCCEAKRGRYTHAELEEAGMTGGDYKAASDGELA